MFGFLQRSRKEIRITCPACRAEQTEPALAISSFCRVCGSHFRIEKGVAVIPPGIRYSGIVESIGESSETAEPESTLGSEAIAPAVPVVAGNRGVGQTWMEVDDEPVAESPTEPTEKSGPNGQGRRRKGRKGRARKNGAAKADPDGKKNATASEKTPAAQTPPESESAPLGKDAQPVETLKMGNMSAMLGDSLEALRVPGPEDEDFRPKMPPGFLPGAGRRKVEAEARQVRCFECHHQQSVSLAATSTQCARCSVYISLADHEISSPWSQNIRTRGDVWVRKRGAVTGCDVACHHLEIDGRISASVDCSGVAHFRHSGRVMGHMHCQKLVVEKKCEVIFPQGVWAESVDVYGTVVGNITCAGTIRIMKNGRVEGDATARAVDLKDGGELSGRMSIQSDLSIVPPERPSPLRML